MQSVTVLLLFTGAYPLWRAWSANRHTTLHHALAWVVLAWLGWQIALLVEGMGLGDWTRTLRYLALCLTAAAGVAVLEPRRPGVWAWHFVTLGLLTVLLLPLAEGRGRLRLSPLQTAFLAATLAVGVLNYLPTRLAPAALLLAAACGVELAGPSAVPAWTVTASRLGLALVPWAALAAASWRRPASEFDRVWLGFRDRCGALWGLRLREQFNRTAANAGWEVRLDWHGLVPARSTQEGEALAALRALLKRFGTAEASP